MYFRILLSKVVALRTPYQIGGPNVRRILPKDTLRTPNEDFPKVWIYVEKVDCNTGHPGSRKKQQTLLLKEIKKLIGGSRQSAHPYFEKLTLKKLTGINLSALKKLFTLKEVTSKCQKAPCSD